MQTRLLSLFLALGPLLSAWGQSSGVNSAEAYLAKFGLTEAPKPSGLLLRKGDRLAICGDSITEQKMYSRIMESYLTACVPELEVSVRQFGWGGEVTGGFLARMTNDVLRFKPTIATTAYGMNDHGYRPYDQYIAKRYEATSAAVVQAFKNAGARVVLGSPGCVWKTPRWSLHTNATKDDLNLNLGKLRNIALQVAQEEKVGFADVFPAMLKADYQGMKKYGPEYSLPGRDGVHPGWAGSLVMAYAFLRGLGLDGEIGTFTVDLSRQTATVSPGHELLTFKENELLLRSRRYPFCAPPGEVHKEDAIRSGLTLVPFHQELNRFMLVVKNPKAKTYRVSWGAEGKLYSQERLTKGINLAEEFPANPFSEAFAKLDTAVGQKQTYETHQIKDLFRSPEAKADLEAVALSSEKERAPLVAAIKSAFVPVTHSIFIVPQ